MKKTKNRNKNKKNVEMSPQYGFSNFQVPKILEKNMQKNLILHFFEMSAFETEEINMSLLLTLNIFNTLF